MPAPRVALLVLSAAVFGLAACAGNEGETGTAESGATESVESAAAVSSTEASTTTLAGTSTTLAATETTAAASAEDGTAETTDNEEDTMATEPPEPVCTRLTDFSTDALNQQWLVVNDDVMGGQSLGGRSFENDTMIFAGEVNTDGGGFASLRFPLEAGSLAEFTEAAIRARPDDRTYVITFDDSLPARNRRVSHRAPIPFESPGQWQTVTIPFEDLFPAIFGQPIDDLPFRPDLAVRMGLMISDGLDGPFQLDVDWIDLCP